MSCEGRLVEAKDYLALNARRIKEEMSESVNIQGTFKVNPRCRSSTITEKIKRTT